MEARLLTSLEDFDFHQRCVFVGIFEKGDDHEEDGKVVCGLEFFHEFDCRLSMESPAQQIIVIVRIATRRERRTGILLRGCLFFKLLEDFAHQSILEILTTSHLSWIVRSRPVLSWNVVERAGFWLAANCYLFEGFASGGFWQWWSCRCETVLVRLLVERQQAMILLPDKFLKYGADQEVLSLLTINKIGVFSESLHE